MLLTAYHHHNNYHSHHHFNHHSTHKKAPTPIFATHALYNTRQGGSTMQSRPAIIAPIISILIIITIIIVAILLALLKKTYICCKMSWYCSKQASQGGYHAILPSYNYVQDLGNI